jgi:hypothetical protein
MTNALYYGIIGSALILYAALIAALILARGWRKAKEEGFVFVFICLCTLVSMATKPTRGRVDYPYTDIERRYLFDRGSYVTNNLIHVDFTRASFVPASAPLYGYARPCESTNDLDWVQFLETTFAAFPVPQDIPYPGAETNVFMFFTPWTPGPAAHTNGVAVVYWRATSGNTAAPLRTGIYTNAVRVAPNPAITNSWPLIINLKEDK